MDLKKKSDFYETFSGSEEGIKKVPMQCKTFKKKRKLKNWLPTQVFFKWLLVFVAQKVLPIKFFTFFFIVTCECICDFFLLRQKFTETWVYGVFFQMQHLGIVCYNFKWVQIICSRHLTLFYLTVTIAFFLKERIKMDECNN